MPRMRNMDDSQRDAQRTTSAGVCEPAQVRYPRKRREDWPFRFYTENGRIYENYVPKRERRLNLEDVEDALL